MRLTLVPTIDDLDILELKRKILSSKRDCFSYVHKLLNFWEVNWFNLKIQPFNHHLKITVEALVNPSEDVDKVKSAIRNLINYIDSDFLQDNKIITTSTNDERSLYHIYEYIRSKNMLAVVRRLLLSRMNKDATCLIFNKQAAFVGSVNVCEEESEPPLGPIKIIIQSDYLHEFIEWLAPK